MSPSAALTDVLVKSQQTSKSHCEVYTQLRKRQFQYFYPPVDEHRVVPYSMSASIWCSTSPSCSSFHVQYFLSCKFSFFLPITRSYTYSGVVFQRGDGFYISGSQIYHTTCHHSKYIGLSKYYQYDQHSNTRCSTESSIWRRKCIFNRTTGLFISSSSTSSCTST